MAQLYHFSMLEREQFNTQVFLILSDHLRLLIQLELERNPTGELLAFPSMLVNMRITNIIPEATPSYFWHEKKKMNSCLPEIKFFWQLFWKPNSAHSTVPIMDKTTVDTLFGVFNRSLPQNESEIVDVMEIRAPPAVNAIVFATLALSAQCHIHLDVGSKFYVAARNVCEEITNRNGLEYLLAVTLLVFIKGI